MKQPKFKNIPPEARKLREREAAIIRARERAWESSKDRAWEQRMAIRQAYNRELFELRQIMFPTKARPHLQLVWSNDEIRSQ